VIKLSIHVSQQVPNMFSFLKRKSKKTEDVQVEEQLEQIIEKPVISEPSTLEADIASNAIVEPESWAIDVPSEPVVEEKKPGLFGRLKERLSKTSSKLTSGFASLILGKKTIDDDLLEELETQLLTADLGIDATQTIINDLTQRVARKQLGDAVALFSALRDDMVDILEPSSLPLVIPEKEGPYVILMVGINGVGKTTTIGKLAKQFQSQGKSVMLAAGDTFRAAAVEQLQVWGDRNNIPVISQHSGADSASVIFDALQAAKARNTDILIADTAGRLHTQSNLMEELKKVKRVMAKLDVEAPHEIMLVLDAGTGQNALSQAVQFNEAVGVTGITLTKLDGTAKGGIIFAIAKKTGLPIRYIGVGETIDDLRPFKADEFVDALLGREE
jgi:fused signal recognition particle receptor